MVGTNKPKLPVDDKQNGFLMQKSLALERDLTTRGGSRWQVFGSGGEGPDKPLTQPAVSTHPNRLHERLNTQPKRNSVLAFLVMAVGRLVSHAQRSVTDSHDSNAAYARAGGG